MKRMTNLTVCLLIALCQVTSCSGAGGTDTPASDGTQTGGDTAVTSGTDAPASGTAAEVLPMIKNFSQSTEWDGEILLAVNEYSDAVLSEAAAGAYPALADTLTRTHGAVERADADEFESLLTLAKDELTLLGADSFVTKESTLDVQIRRADSIAVSLLSDSYLVYGKINDRGVIGTTYDTETGKELAVTDVIRDMSEIPAIVKKELSSHTWTGDFSSESAVEDYFRDTPAEGISWTLDYNGVTFYFGNGDIAELGHNGRLAATVSFAEYPNLFEPKYMTAPAAYIAELGLNHPFYTNLDGDTALEELTVTPFRADSGFEYASFGIYTDTDAYFSEFAANTAYRTGGYHPYYVKTSDDRHYLYVFADSSALASNDTQLRVIDLTGGACK